MRQKFSNWLLLVLISVTFLLTQSSRNFATTKNALLIDLSFSSEKGFPLQFIQLTIVAPTSNVSWQYEASDRSEIDSFKRKESLQASNWYTIPGEYKFVVVYRTMNGFHHQA